MTFEHLQGSLFRHFPGMPLPMPENHLTKEIFPNAQPKPSLVQLEAIFSCHLLGGGRAWLQPPFRCLCRTRRSPSHESFLLSRLNIPALSCSSQDPKVSPGLELCPHQWQQARHCWGRAGLVGTWHAARVNPPQRTTHIHSSTPLQNHWAFFLHCQLK